MPPNKTPSPDRIYQIKIVRRGSKPPVWRRVLVPAGLTLAQLHHVLQATIGWWDAHLHEFEIGPDRFGVPNIEMEEVRNERAVRMSTALHKVGAKARYTYHFGDGWVHDVLVERVLLPEPGQAYPFFAWLERAVALLRIAAASGATTTCWPRSPTRITNSTRNSPNGSA